MQIVADLHSHSRYSRAVSQRMNLEEVAKWSSRKGISLVATGDWNHPVWLREIKSQLVETSEGIFTLKKRPEEQKNDVKFLLTTELATAYTKGGRGRKVHHLIFSPSFETCDKITAALLKRGFNLMYDGRPIIGISCKDLLGLILEIDDRCLLIPAHAWTPWFGIFGSKSGFDSLSECFEELEKYIYGIETGLSSDPIMNWGVPSLQNKSILSFSDAHSAPKLGREATVFVPNANSPLHASSAEVATKAEQGSAGQAKFTYKDIVDAIKQDANGTLKIGYTIEFFPEEGKYHWTGHRTCNVKYGPDELKKKGVICPVCQRPLTVGVEKRVADLSQKDYLHDGTIKAQNKNGLTFVYEKARKRPPFVSLIPLLEVLTEVHNSPTQAAREYDALTVTLATEFDILLRTSYEEIGASGGTKLRGAIQRIRERNVVVDPGYDGVFGKVAIFDHEKQAPAKQEAEGHAQATLF